MAAKVATRAATAAGFLCNGDSSSDVLSGVLEAIIKTSTIKSEALHFAVGEALCFAFGGRRTCALPCHFEDCLKYVGGAKFSTDRE